MASSTTTTTSSSPLVLFFYLLFSALFVSASRFGPTTSVAPAQAFTLQSVRDSLVRQEDTIVFSLIERAKYPFNSFLYDPSCYACGGSLLEFFVKESEYVQAKAGRYQNPEEIPFFPEDLPEPLVPPFNFSKVLYPAAANVNLSQTIRNAYTEKLLPLFTAKGDDGNYASTAASDLVCLQALSRRIHYGRFVAEVKFRDAPQDYTPLIRSRDRDALMKLLTSASVEEEVKRRVAKKAMIFGQNVTVGDEANSTDSKMKYKVDPAVVFGLYDEWVVPLTKVVEVEYLLRRLD